MAYHLATPLDAATEYRWRAGFELGVKRHVLNDVMALGIEEVREAAPVR